MAYLMPCSNWIIAKAPTYAASILDYALKDWA